MIRNVLKKLGLIHVAFIAAVGLPFIIAPSANAQNPAPEASPAAAAAPAGAQAEAERVIVTGSNIPTAEEVGPNPVLNLNRDLINKSGSRTTEQILRDTTVVNGNGISAQNNGTNQQGPDGSAAISLRGFDVSSTLVLVDGRRVAPFASGGVNGANGGGAFVDLNTIPLAAVESIEILKDGASATYGADAVAGVVNIKLYKDYRGAQVTLYYGDTLDKDAGLYDGDVLFGTGDDKVSVTGDIYFYHHNSLFNRDRGNTLIPPFLSTNTIPWNFNVSTAVATTAGAPVAPGAGTTEFVTPPNGTNGLSAPGTYVANGTLVRGPRAAGTILPGFNFNLFSSNFPESERWGGYAAFSDKVCDDQVVLYGDFYYDETKVHDELAPLATNDFQTQSQFTLFIPPHSPIASGAEPPNTPTAAAVGEPVGAFNPFNPFNQIISGGSRARLLDFGNRLENLDNHAWLVTLGVKGDKLFDGSWGYDAGFRYSQIQTTSSFQGINGPKFEEVLNGNSSIFQPGSSDFVGTTVPYNPFGSGNIASNDKLVDFSRSHTNDLAESKLTTLDTNIYTTDLFDLPAGGVGLAFGGGWRREVLTEQPDDQDRLPVEALGVSFETPFHIGREDYDFYAETRIPLFSPEMGIWGLHSMEFSAAGRYEDFRNNDSNVLVPKVELRWQPFDEQLTFRSTWGEGFLEPSLGQLQGGPAFTLSATSFKNPVTGKTITEAETTTEFDSNPNLQPERSRTWTGGVVYTPKWVENLVPNLTATASIDLWDIERQGVVISPTAQQVVGRFERGALLPGEEVDLDPTGTFVSFVKSFFQNAGRENGRGADFSLQVQYQTANWGTFSWLTQASYLDSFIFQASALAKGREVSGRANEDPFDGTFFGAATGGDAWLKWKGNSRIDWTWKNFDLNWTVHYLDGFREIISYITNPDGTPGAHQHFVHGTWFFDCQASYTLIFTTPVESQPVAGYSKGGKEVMTGKDGKEIESAAAYSMPCWKTILNNSTFTVGCNDVFGQDPPKMFGFEEGNATNYPPELYDNLGRFVYFEIKKKF